MPPEQPLHVELLQFWNAGGVLMYPLAILGFLIYLSIFELLFYLLRNNYNAADRNEWGHWVDVPEESSGEIGNIIKFTQNGAKSVADVRGRFEELKAAHIPRIDIRINFITVLIGVAPIAGLLGTVMGMLNTFLYLSSNTSGQSTVDLVAGGISEALITTQTGLVLAIPAYLLVYFLRRYQTSTIQFMTELEILTVKKFERIQNKKAA